MAAPNESLDLRFDHASGFDIVRTINIPSLPEDIIKGLEPYESAARGFTTYRPFELLEDAALLAGHIPRLFYGHRPQSEQMLQIYSVKSENDTKPERITHFQVQGGRTISAWVPILGDNLCGIYRKGGAIFTMDLDGSEMNQLWRYWEDDLQDATFETTAAELDNAPGGGRIVRAARVALTTSFANLLILTILHGEQLACVCLASCRLDVLINAMVLFWVTSGLSNQGNTTILNHLPQHAQQGRPTSFAGRLSLKPLPAVRQIHGGGFLTPIREMLTATPSPGNPTRSEKPAVPLDYFQQPRNAPTLLSLGDSREDLPDEQDIDLGAASMMTASDSERRSQDGSSRRSPRSMRFRFRRAGPRMDPPSMQITITTNCEIDVASSLWPTTRVDLNSTSRTEETTWKREMHSLRVVTRRVRIAVLPVCTSAGRLSGCCSRLYYRSRVT